MITFALAAFAFATQVSPASQLAPSSYLDAVAVIKAGNPDCPHCILAGADLSNHCFKLGNLEGADFDNTKLVMACLSFANFRGATFRGADLSGANLAHAKLDGTNLTGAEMNITSIKGTDLSRTIGLTQHQLDQACGDAETKVPEGLRVKICQ